MLQDKAWKENLDCENHKIFIRTNREKRKKMEEEEEKKSSLVVGEKKEERQTNSVGGEEEETLTSLDQGEGGGKEIAIA